MKPMNKPTIAILIPAHNEEMSIAVSVQSCLNQTRTADQIIFINDGSTDRTGEILARYGDKIHVVTIPKATGNKSRAQEVGLTFVTSDIVVMSDADTIIDSRFLERIEADFENTDAVAVAGHVRSMKKNWLTACRSIEYVIAQNIHKIAQHYIGYIFVLPGAAVAFRTDVLKSITMNHETICEDLDITYFLHEKNARLIYDMKAIVYTLDPSTVGSYATQVRRWYRGGIQCLFKHWRIMFTKPNAAFELPLTYLGTVVSALLLFILPALSITFFLAFFSLYVLFALGCAIFSAIVERRPFLLLATVPFLFVIYLNSYLLLESLAYVVLFRHKTLTWHSPQRYATKQAGIPSLTVGELQKINEYI